MKERTDTSIVDPDHPAETARLMVQDSVMTEGMHGLFPERRDILGIQSILDVGCGSGGWVFDVAHVYPDASVVGIDRSPTVVAYNQAQAMVQHMDNVQFLVMDALQPLTFAGEPFDLVNVRFAASFIPKGQWGPFLQHCLSALRPGGILRVTECEVVGLTNSPAVEQMHTWAAHLLAAHGYGFSPDGSHIGILPMLGPLLQEAGCVHMGSQPHTLDFSWGTSLHDRQYQNYMVWPILIEALLLATLSVKKEEFDHTYQDMLYEMHMPQFRGLWSVLTVWGEKE